MKVKAFCSFIIEYSFNSLGEMPLDTIREKLLSVYGIGKETADSIILYALGKPSFVVDSYTKRIVSRIGIINDNISYDSLKILIEGAIPKKTEIYNELHAYFVKLAKDNCRKIPICDNCPISSLCAYYKLR
jgi:endonuclease-3 related protein